MKLLFLFSFIVLQTVSVLAKNDIEVDKKTGLVTSDGKEMFYLIPQNTQLFTSDYILQNLAHKELAYLKRIETPVYRNGKQTSDLSYQMVFTKTGNQCLITDGFSVFVAASKSLAKMIIAANLVQNDDVSFEEERKFVLLHNGVFLKNPANKDDEKIVINAAPPAEKKLVSAEILIKENKIYNNSELVGVYKLINEEGNDVIKIYNNMDALVCVASHQHGNDSDDWHLSIEGKNSVILYNPAAPLEKLFKYLAERSIL